MLTVVFLLLLFYVVCCVAWGGQPPLECATVCDSAGVCWCLLVSDVGVCGVHQVWDTSLDGEDRLLGTSAIDDYYHREPVVEVSWVYDTGAQVWNVGKKMTSHTYMTGFTLF